MTTRPPLRTIRIVVACIWGTAPRSSYLNASWLKIRLRSRSRRDGELRRPSPAGAGIARLLGDRLGAAHWAGILQDRLRGGLGQERVAAVGHVQAVGGEELLGRQLTLAHPAVHQVGPADHRHVE